MKKSSFKPSRLSPAIERVARLLREESHHYLEKRKPRTISKKLDLSCSNRIQNIAKILREETQKNLFVKKKTKEQ